MKTFSLPTVVLPALFIVTSTEAAEPAHSVLPSILDGNPNTLLFEVVAAKPTYLYGASHNTAERIRSYLVDTPMQVLKRSDVVFCEASFKDINEFLKAVEQYEEGEWTGDEETERKIVSFRDSCFFPEGSDIFSHCDDQLRKKIESFYARHDKGQRLKSVVRRRVKPLLIAVGDLHNIVPEEPTFVADHVFMREAPKLGIPVKSLDDYPQIQITMGSLALEHQLDYMEYLLDLRAMNNDRHFSNIVDACGTGNINQIYDLFEAIVLPRDREAAWRNRLAQELWDRRNNRWMEKLMPHVGKSTNFVVVGATHLGGSTGLIRLFEQKGYEVRPIDMKPR